MRILTKSTLVPVAALLLLTTPAFAKPKTKAYPQSCSALWPAVKIAVSTQHYNFADMNDKDMKGLVSTGNNWSGKRYLDITLVASDGGGCTVAIGGQPSGLAHNDKGDLFARIDDALKAGPAAAAPATATAAPATGAAPAPAPPPAETHP